MHISRAIRLTILVVAELAKKYTRSLFLGFIVGILLSSLFWKMYPLYTRYISSSTHHIGMVGEFTPSTLPLIIQQDISTGITALFPDGNVRPDIASSWEATNSGKTFIFTIGNTSVWHNGKQVTAHDINYNIRGVTFVPTGDKTLIAYLQYPYSPFPTLLSKPIFLPGLNGVGSYRVNTITLRGGTIKSLFLSPSSRQFLPSLHYSFFQTEAMASLAYQLGEVDQLRDLSTVSGELASWGNTTITERTKYDRIVTLFFNTKNPLFSDKTFRQALAYGIPDLPYERANSPISKMSWAYTKNVKTYGYNPKEALRLLKESEVATSAGKLTLSTFPRYLDVAQKIADSWTALGVSTSVQVENSTPIDYHVLLSAQDIPPDPDQYPFWHSTQTATNITGYVNVKIDKLLEDGRVEFDTAKRKTIYADFQRRLVEDVPAVFLYYPKIYFVQRGK